MNFNQNHFFSFEKKNDLFNKKKSGLYYWDIIRFEIYYDLLWNYSSKKVKGENFKTPKKQIFFDFIRFLNFLLFKKFDYLFFTASRNKIGDNKVFDQNLGDILGIYSKEAILFESIERDRNRWYYQNTLYNPIYIFRKIVGYFYKQADYSEIIDLLKEEFKRSDFGNHQINNIVNDFKTDFNYYSWIFRTKKPKMIFITQNGIQKGLFSAAKKYNIPVVEVQHGIIDEGHLGYNYNRNIEYKSEEVYLPTYFFTFTDFWAKDLFFPVKEIISMGNSFFYNSSVVNNVSENNAKGLLVASSDVFGEDLKNLVIQFSMEMKNVPVYFKLHPNQFAEKQYYRKQFLDCPNVKVYANEKSIYELLAISKSVIVIQSTALYEALHLKKTAIIFKKQTYYRHSHIFGIKNVFLINGVEDLKKYFDVAFVESSKNKDLFFKKFDFAKFSKFITENK